MDKLLYGAAYYDEYMPCDRLKEDIRLMKKAGVNVVRIAESTWATYEPEEGVFDFSHVTRVLDAMEENGIQVIVGTPTYAIPSWMEKAHPDVMVTTKEGRTLYGPRQMMDLTHAGYRFYCERIIRRLMEVTAHRKCVIGFQLDNETRHYNTAGPHVQQLFVKHLKKKFHDNINALNDAFGFNYWSNRISSWEDFPDVRNTINGSLAAAFDEYRRGVVTEFLTWQSMIVREYARPDQFITHNLDFEWRGYSYGIHPASDHPGIAKCLTVCGTDIYHHSQDLLTGIEIAMGGDLSRSHKNDNYLVLETLAQGYPYWTPYKDQLRLQAFCHLASGANAVMYWHWHSLHNSFETYWKGLLSHDFQENAHYQEACTVGRDFERLSPHLVNLKKHNRVAVLVSNTAYDGLRQFPINGQDGPGYNDVMRKLYDSLYRMNVECDFVWPHDKNLSRYDAILVPALYAADDALIRRLHDYVEQGGHLLATFKTGFCDENIKVRHDLQPHGLTDVFGVTYSQFALPRNVHVKGELLGDCTDTLVTDFLEALTPTTANTVLSYDHYNWGAYAAVTENAFGTGHAMYVGAMLSDAVMEKVLSRFLTGAGVPVPELRFPVVLRKGKNQLGKTVMYYMNFSACPQSFTHNAPHGTELVTGVPVAEGETVTLKPWGFNVIEC